MFQAVLSYLKTESESSILCLRFYFVIVQTEIKPALENPTRVLILLLQLLTAWTILFIRRLDMNH